MKKIVLFFLALPFFAAAKEPARTGTATREARWEQTLTEWTTTQNADSVSFSAPFRVPFEWIERRQIVRLEGVSGAFELSVNGRPAGGSQAGMEPSEFDITDVAREGLNELRITVHRDYAARKLEDGTPHGEPGLVDSVRVISQPLLRVRDIAVRSRFENTVGLMELGVVMRSHRLNRLTYNVAYELQSPDGQRVAWEDKDFSVDMRRDDTVRFFARVKDAREWTVDSAALYTLNIKTVQRGRVRERVTYKVAFQRPERPAPVTREFTPSDSLPEMVAKIDTLKKEGVNTLILSGLPATDAFYDLCDSVGIYVCPTAWIDTHLSGPSRKVGGNPSNDPAWGEEYAERILAMYHRAKNHPSVALFRLAADGSANGINLYDNYLTLKRLEPSRPIIYATDEWNTDFP